jgi:hypothetical protein
LGYWAGSLAVCLFRERLAFSKTTLITEQMRNLNISVGVLIGEYLNHLSEKQLKSQDGGRFLKMTNPMG